MVPPQNTSKPLKFHIKFKKTKKFTSKRNLYLFDENANDIPEEDDNQPPHQDIVYMSNDGTVAVAPGVHVATQNSSITAINDNDDSGCFSNETSFKTDAGDAGTSKRSRVRLNFTQRTEIDQNFWNINDNNQENDEEEEGFVAIYVKPGMEDESSEHTRVTEPSLLFDGGERLENVPPEVSIQVEKGFSMRQNTESVNRAKKRVIQRRNEWRKAYFKHLRY